MAPRSVEVIASGPPSPDPYHPTAPAWALAAALGARGNLVRVLHPAGPAGAPPPAGTTAVPLPLKLRRPGASLEAADWARVAGHHLLPGTELVVRDPAGLGALGLGRPGHRPAALAGFVRSLELSRLDGDLSAHRSPGVLDRVDAWRDRRAVRRLERDALAEADRLFVESPELRDTLTKEYGLEARRLVLSVPPVASRAMEVSREKARNGFSIPLDVPVVAALTATDDPGPAGVDRIREAFRRIRPIFPGVRLIVAGAPSPPDPGVVAAPVRDGSTFDLALSAADVAVFPTASVGFDPGVVLALRAGVASIVLPEVRLPGDSKKVVRAVASNDPGDLASVLAELVADPDLRRDLAEAGRGYAAPFDPATVAADVEKVGLSSRT
jgi:hypothetical protein